MISSLRKSISKRLKFTTKHTQTQSGRPAERTSPEIQPATSAQPIPGFSGRADERGTVITDPTQDIRPPAPLFEVPVPRTPQETQDSNDDDDDDEEGLYDHFEPVPDEFVQRFNETLFRERLQALLNRATESKDREPPITQEFKTSRGFLEAKKVPGESMRIERHPEEPETQPMESDQSGFNLPSTSAQSSIASSVFGIQDIGEDHLTDRGKLGAGRSGMVYLAHWHGADVAVKIFHSSDAEEGERAMNQEVKNLSVLKHPSIVTLYGRCYIKRMPAIVLEFVPGGSLRSALIKLRQERGRAGALGLRFKLQIALQAAYAMYYFHFRNMVHFDVKAENFLCDLRDLSHPIVKAADVGLSKHKIASFVSGSMRGTLPWMAPELFPDIQRRESIDTPYVPPQVSNKVDVYSFGIMMWEIWSMGAEPYRNMSAMDVFYHILDKHLRPGIPRDCNEDWSRLMQACWQSDPEKRPSFRQITDSLDYLLKKF